MQTLIAQLRRRPLATALLALICVGVIQSSTQPSVGAASNRVLIVQNLYYALPGKAAEVYLWRLHASEVRAKLGLARGRVLRRLPDPKAQGDLPDVIWECEYPSLEAREADVTRLDKSGEFVEVEKHMDTLIRNFRRVMFEAGD